MTCGEANQWNGAVVCTKARDHHGNTHIGQNGTVTIVWATPHKYDRAQYARMAELRADEDARRMALRLSFQHQLSCGCPECRPEGDL